MENKLIEKKTEISFYIIAILMSLFGLSVLCFGVIYLIGSGNADPTENLGLKPAILRQGQIVAILTLIYFISCIIFLVFFKNGKGFAKYVLSGLGILHIFISYSFLFLFPYWASEDIRLLFYSSLIMNLILVTTMILSKKKTFPQNDKNNKR